MKTLDFSGLPIDALPSHYRCAKIGGIAVSDKKPS
jgi:hypothetical protein